MNKADLLSTITAGHDEMTNLVRRISDDRLRDRAMDDWTGKDVVAHMAWWHDHSASAIEALRSGSQPYDAHDPSYSTDALNERVHREHVEDAPDVVRVAFDQSFERLRSALEPLSHEDLFDADRWPWCEGEALVEMILWDTSRHYDAHVEHLAPLAGQISA
jgi:hypothetical protein